MNILVIGSGGRECTFAWKLAQSAHCDNLYIAPGNAGTSSYGENISIDPNDFDAVRKLVLEKEVGLVVIGPEDPLVNGIHDFFLADEDLSEVPVIGPQQHGAKLEGSKEFAKEFMARHGIPTAKYKSFTADTLDQGLHFLESMEPPYVLKADGLAAGKGVLILNELEEARNELKEMLGNRKFGEASSKVVIEEFLDGIELSSFVLTDGKGYLTLPNAKDYKRIGEGDQGLNTGGMGAISPVPFADEEFLQKVERRIIRPTIEGLKKDKIPYVGFVFIGLIKVGEDPYVIEYNVRMGDPETEVVLPRIKTDLVELLNAAANQALDDMDLEIDSRSAATVVLVSGGYPEAYEKGKVIRGVDRVVDSLVFHAGTQSIEGELLTSGGRVLAITSYGKDFRQALETSYKNIEKISFEKMNFRKDIGFDL